MMLRFGDHVHSPEPLRLVFSFEANRLQLQNVAHRHHDNYDGAGKGGPGPANEDTDYPSEEDANIQKRRAAFLLIFSHPFELLVDGEDNEVVNFLEPRSQMVKRLRFAFGEATPPQGTKIALKYYIQHRGRSDQAATMALITTNEHCHRSRSLYILFSTSTLRAHQQNLGIRHDGQEGQGVRGGARAGGGAQESETESSDESIFGSQQSALHTQMQIIDKS